MKTCLQKSIARKLLFLTSICVPIACNLSFSEAAEPDAQPVGQIVPLLKVADLKVGEAQNIELHDGSQVRIKLISIAAEREPVQGMIKSASVVVDVNGQQATVESGNYRLPVEVNGVQIDCPLTRHYNEDTTQDHWGLTADARVRLWPKSSPWITPDSFDYPVNQRWMAAMTWFSNEPVSKRPNGKVYYHAGMDIGATERLAEVVAATDGVIVSAGDEILAGDHPPVNKRYDVIYVRDGRGWYYRYSHLDEFDPEVAVGARVTRGQRLGLVGKEGASGGWSHLHFEIKSMQPSGKWGTQDSYAFLWQAYQRQYAPEVIAISRPYQRAFTGSPVTLDAKRSWAKSGIAKYEWTFSDGSEGSGAEVTQRYTRPGMYSEVLKVTDKAGNIDYDFATVRVNDSITGRQSPGIDANYAPSTGIQPGDEVTFTSRGRNAAPSEDIWDFGDGSPKVTTRSNIDSDQHAQNGYASTTHKFKKPGDYIVSVTTKNEHGDTATSRLHVRVERGK
ncbi:PKD domain-containing protein [Thalassoglobus sp.]|uniref:PKD domain-containing protein n=1 Tax=Thalassoglobus sp. TaxID=2795869 RepID=UPI003AA7C3B4